MHDRTIEFRPGKRLGNRSLMFDYVEACLRRIGRGLAAFLQAAFY